MMIIPGWALPKQHIYPAGNVELEEQPLCHQVCALWRTDHFYYISVVMMAVRYPTGEEGFWNGYLPMGVN